MNSICIYFSNTFLGSKLLKCMLYHNHTKFFFLFDIFLNRVRFICFHIRIFLWYSAQCPRIPLAVWEDTYNYSYECHLLAFILTRIRCIISVMLNARVKWKFTVKWIYSKHRKVAISNINYTKDKY